MRKILMGIWFMALAGTLSIAAPPQDRDDHRDRDDRHDNGKHKGLDKHDDRDRHDNGNHKGWDNPHNPHANWDADHDRVQPGRAYPHGRYEHVRSDFVARRMDFRTRRVPTTSTAAAIGSGTTTASTSTTTIITLAGTCSSTPASAATSTSNTSVCTEIHGACGIRQ